MNEKQLEESILHHDKKYWVDNNPEISDPDYDAMCRRLRVLNPESRVLHQVHRAVVSKGATVERDKPMLSLDKAYEVPEVKKWALSVSRTPSELFRIGPKYDGLACELDGDILATSGDDGITGEDISDKLVIVDLSRLGESSQGLGELVVMKSDLPTLTRDNGEFYKNCRAAAVGLINADNTDRSIGRVVKFMPHDTSLELFEIKDFDLVNWDLMLDTEQNNVDYPADGLVIALCDTEYGETLGATEHHPRHSLALKFKNPSAKTKLIDIEWQCGKHKLTPVAILEPVVMSGCTHDRASLHNWAMIEKMGLMTGDTVTVERCGDVIPQLTGHSGERSSHLKEIFPPANCPACGSETIIRGIDVCCPNEQCGGTTAKRLLDSLNRIGIESIGPTVASQLVNAGFVTLPAVFDMGIQEWTDLPGFAGPSAKKMHSQFQKRLLTPIEDYRILAAMNIQGLGLTMSKKICAAHTLSEVPVADLQKLEGIGPERAAAIRSGFDFGLYTWAVTSLNVQITKGLADRPLICFTGANPVGRAEWIERAEAKGYTYKGAVTKALTLLVCGDLKSTSSKMVKAAKYGVRVVTYDQFMEGENV